MYKTAFAIAVVVVCTSTALSLTGSGTEADPYRIRTHADYREFARTSTYWDDHIRLETDIGLYATSYETAVVALDTRTEARFQGTAFTGVFDGNDHTISGMHIDCGDKEYAYLGFCGYLDGGQIRDLTLADITVNGNGIIGGLVAYNDGGVISNCRVTGSVTGTLSTVGGFVGWNGGDISDCVAEVDTTGVGNVSAFAGYHANGTMSRCSATGITTGRARVGGLVGHSDFGAVISDCNSAGSLTGWEEIGGLVGHNDRGSISNSHSSVDVSAHGRVDYDSDVGGLVGRNIDGSISGCYSTGQLSSVIKCLGGLIGRNEEDSSVSDCYSTASLSSDHDIVGGLIAINYGSVTRCYYRGDITGMSHIGGLCGLNAGTGTVSDCNAIGTIDGADSLGVLMGSNTGTISNCSAAGDVSGAEKVGGLTGSNQGDISNCSFDGSVYGTGNAVGGLVGYSEGDEFQDCWSSGDVRGDDHVGGLVGYNRSTDLFNCHSTAGVRGRSLVGGLAGESWRAIISDCSSAGQTNGAERSDDDRTGGLVGMNNDGTIRNSFSSGNTIGGNIVGGLVGRNMNEGHIQYCYSVGDVQGSNYVGGLIGDNILQASVSDCYSLGDVQGRIHVGGFLGRNSASNVSSCYSTGDVDAAGAGRGEPIWIEGGFLGSNDSQASVYNCFWNECVQTHDVNESIGESEPGAIDVNVVGLPTETMLEESTYTSAGWDFTNESDNGTEDMWTICDGTHYPRFVWQIPSTDLVCPYGTDFLDYSFFVRNWPANDCANSNGCNGADFDHSGRVDAEDFSIFCANWLVDVEPDLRRPAPAKYLEPSDEAFEVELELTLSWAPGCAAVSHNVHFGTTNPPPFQVNQTETTFSPDVLSEGTTYYWRIDEVNPYGATPGAVWRFRTTSGKTRCFPADTVVWIDGEMMEISQVVAGATVDKPSVGRTVAQRRQTVCAHRIDDIDVHDETDSWERHDIVFENGNTLAVADSHYFLLDSGKWAPVEKLSAGSKLSTLEGAVTVKTIRKSRSSGTVYNLKISDSERYLVGKDGVVVRDW